MNVRTRTARATLFVVALASVLALAGCGSEIEGNAIAKSGTVPATGSSPTSESSEPTTTRSAPPTQNGGDQGGDVDIDVEIGECVQLGGTVDDATIDNAICGAPDSNYKVIAKVPSGDLCVSDADQYYYESFGGVEQGALCLDIDWVIGGCMDLGGDDPARIDCSEPAIDGARVTDIIAGTVDASECNADYGRVYDERIFVVCYDEI